MSRDGIDYEKKFEEDLERAQALSLESLALEQFKTKKLQEINNQAKNKSASVSRASSMTETDSNAKYEQSKSRPRPGTSTSSLTSSSLLAPPPQRKTSLGVDSPDLISFVNAPVSTSSSIIEFCNIPRYNTANVRASLTSQSSLQTVNYGNRSQTMHFTPQMSQVWFRQNPLNTGPRHVFSPHRPAVKAPPVLPPKNVKKTPPPLTLPSSRSSSANSQRPLEILAANLIDLAPSVDENDHNSVRVSILQEFDPILSLTPELPDLQQSVSSVCDDSMSVCDSEYDVYDPYDLYTGSGNTSLSDSIYHNTIPAQSPPPPLPPRPYKAPIQREPIKTTHQVKSLRDSVVKREFRTKDADLTAFYQMVVTLRKLYKYNDPDTNMGFVISPMVSYQYQDGLSIRLCVYPDFDGADMEKSVNFTCDVNSSIEHITLQLTCDLEAPTKDKYTLKVHGSNEYLAPASFLSDYEYVHNCIKLDADVVLTLIPDSKVDKSFARTLQDDSRGADLTFDEVVCEDSAAQVNYEKVAIVLEAVEKEMKLLENAALQLENYQSTVPLQPSPVIQSVRCAVNVIGCLATTEIMVAVANLYTRSKQHHVDNMHEDICSICGEIRSALLNIIALYSVGFNADFEVPRVITNAEVPRQVQDIVDPLTIRLCSIYKPPPEWKHDSFMLAMQLYHGLRPLGHPLLSNACPKTEQDHWPSRITFDCMFDLPDIPISALAREARILFVVYGRKLEAPENNNDSSAEPKYKQEEIGWASCQFFDYEGLMIHGGLLLSIWPPDTQFLHGAPPSAGTHPAIDHPVLELQILTPRAQFPLMQNSENANGIVRGDFNSLDLQTQQQLLDICEQDMLMKLPTEIREVLWEKRHYLYHIPEALPKVLLAARNWEYACLADLHGMLRAWRPLKPIHALQLLLPSFPDLEVRKTAVRWLCGLKSDELIDYIPQLVVALRHEIYENSPLARFMLDRALRSPRFAHHLFWLLARHLPATSETPEPITSESISEVRHYRRVKLILKALLAICGEALKTNFQSQQLLVKELDAVADAVKKSKDSHRLAALHSGLSLVHANLADNPTSLPLSPTLKVNGIQTRSSFYFPSNTLPIKISFLAADGSTTLPAIYKVGDDLQQDMLTLQVVRLMDKLWLNQGLDLKIVSFVCVATGFKRGMIEMVTNADTLRKIQVEHGLTGSFKDKPIAEWLAKHNPSELEYGRAVENFTASCAGYCVVTYILGICDRHNDNIMLKTSGHLFHIDFGKFLGDAQMFGNFKRDRTPFVLTSDMAYVINGGDRPSEKFHKFVDLCCQAFNIIRANANLFLYIFTLMASSGICGMTPESVAYLHKALLPNMSNPEAAAYFARLIESSLKSWFTQFNFFLHNLAQLKFSNDHDADGTLLSFVPKTYTRATDGRLVHVKVVCYKKRYDPDKYYVYVLRVYRADTAGFMDIHRTYKEFCELHQKLCIYFPLAKLHSLSTGLHVGRSNIKQVAEKRFHEVSMFVTSLFRCAEEIAHSDLVYTFFHPLLRDQQDTDEFGKNSKDGFDGKTGSGILKGQLKLSFQYHKGVFSVMVYHVRGLPLLGNGQEPSTYVKVYLLPDLKKTTKRKTKVVRRNCHPSFVEMLEYRMSLDIVIERRIQATVWNYDALQENEFLGGVELELGAIDDLTKETIEWYPLVNLSR